VPTFISFVAYPGACSSNCLTRLFINIGEKPARKRRVLKFRHSLDGMPIAFEGRPDAVYNWAMAIDETEQPDLWAATITTEQIPRSPQRRLLPHDLDVALKYLTDGELAALAKAVEDEQLRRSPEPAPSPPSATKPVSKKAGAPSVDGLTQSQINLIQSSVKAGVKPAMLSRQFGLTRAQITAALKVSK
jgi:hypothetical protein